METYINKNWTKKQQKTVVKSTENGGLQKQSLHEATATGKKKLMKWMRNEIFFLIKYQDYK